MRTQDGMLSQEELTSLCGKLTAAKAAEAIKEFDHNSDGRISIEEWSSIVKNLGKENLPTKSS
jgi:Ca2+-binding EF-hand superfamily protein